MFDSIDDVLSRLQSEDYFADRQLATSAYLAWRLRKPLLIEGEPGVGKTSLALSLARAADTGLSTLQGYPGMSEAGLPFDWGTSSVPDENKAVESLCAPEPGDRPLILLLDDVHALNDDFVASLVSFLRGRLSRGSNPVSAPFPLAVLTATGVDTAPSALRNASLYHWLGYPSFEREFAILIRTVPALGASLAGQICNFAFRLRSEEFERRPGIGETIDLGRALLALHRESLDADTIDQTLGCIFKHPADIERFRSRRLATRLSVRIDRAG
jgi:MoxR-like ATPase